MELCFCDCGPARVHLLFPQVPLRKVVRQSQLEGDVHLVSPCDGLLLAGEGGARIEFTPGARRPSSQKGCTLSDSSAAELWGCTLVKLSKRVYVISQVGGCTL